MNSPAPPLQKYPPIVVVQKKAGRSSGGKQVEMGNVDGFLWKMPYFQYFDVAPIDFLNHTVAKHIEGIHKMVGDMFSPKSSGEVLSELRKMERIMGSGAAFGSQRLSRVYNYLKLLLQSRSVKASLKAYKK